MNGYKTQEHRQNDNRILKLLEAAIPFMNPGWCQLANVLIHLLSLTAGFRHIRGFSWKEGRPVTDLDGLLCAIQPFCSEEELGIIRMYRQFQQMQKAMDMWKLFSSLMPEGSDPLENLSGLFGAETVFPSSLFSGPDNASHDIPEDFTTDSLLSFLTPEQRSLYEALADAPA